jgi:glycosyltransferase involved in cell wall biosynthesis
MNVLLWHVHGSWTTSFVQGSHTYLVPVVPDRGPDGRGRARTWDWPASVVERTPDELATTPIDLVVLQRPEDLELAGRWLGGRRPGRDIPAVWLEHNSPQGRINEMRHPAADRHDLTVVHVTHANALFWDSGATPTTVIEHGIVDPGPRYTGELPHAAVVINEPERRMRVVGTDLLPRIAAAVPVDLFGMGAEACARRLQAEGHRVTAHEDLPQDRMHDELARRRVYVHTARWTSLGLSLLEAMHLGMPVVALGTLEVPDAVPADAGVVTTRPDVLTAAVAGLAADHEDARLRGKAARAAALDRYGLDRFLDDWDRLMEEVVNR